MRFRDLDYNNKMAGGYRGNGWEKRSDRKGHNESEIDEIEYKTDFNSNKMLSWYNQLPAHPIRYFI